MEDITKLNLCGTLLPHPCDQFLKGKGLGQIVVRTSIQAEDFLFDGGAHRQEQHWSRHSLLSQRLQYLQSVHFGQTDIEDDQVMHTLQG